MRRPLPPTPDEESFFVAVLHSLLAVVVLIGITYFTIWQVTQ